MLVFVANLVVSGFMVQERFLTPDELVYCCKDLCLKSLKKGNMKASPSVLACKSSVNFNLLNREKQKKFQMIDLI